jgi:glucose-6-phosphate dehydrogenase assembly protein OpcA
MAQSVVDRAWRTTTADDIEPHLAELWREIGRQHPVARAVMSNLVVVRERSRSGAMPTNVEELVDQIPLDEVVAQHPSRVVLIQHDRAPQTACAPSAISVGVVTYGPPHARYGVEEILVQSACAEQSLPSIVLRLLRGDVPTSVWWTDDLSRTPPLDAIVEMARQLVYDSRGWRDVRQGVLAVTRFFGRDRRLDLADLNWRRLTPLRHALIHACGATDLDHLRRTHVRIAHRAGEEALAWLAAGWLTARLSRSADTEPRVEQVREEDERVSISVGDVTAEMNDHRVRVTCQRTAPFTVGVPDVGEADAVAAELRNLGHDACLHDALSALAARFS